MILQDTLYHTVSMQETDSNQFSADIALHGKSVIFQSHFPDFPILPGACLVQMSKEYIEQKRQQKIQITLFKNLKFLRTINPLEYPEITAHFMIREKEGAYLANVTYSKQDVIFCKLDYLFIPQ